MIVLGVVATWIALSIVGAKGLLLFARAAASSELDVEVVSHGGPGHEEARLQEVRAHMFGARP